MSEDEKKIREKRLRILQGLFSKTKENGATEEESASAIAHAQKLMDDWAIEDYELGVVFEKKTFVARELKLKYGNKWRWEIANQLAWNTGVYALHYKGRKETIVFRGREQHVEAAALLAEFIIGQIEELSSDFAKRIGGGSTERRRFARGCAIRVKQRIHRAHNLTADPRLPVILEKARDEAKEDFGVDVRNKRTQNREEDSVEFIMGFRKGDQVNIRHETKRLED